MYYFLNVAGTLCHILDNKETGEAPDPCGAKARKLDLIIYREGKSNRILLSRPTGIPLCKHCEKALKWARAV